MPIPTIEIMTKDIKNPYNTAYIMKKTLSTILILLFFTSFFNLYAQEMIFQAAEELFMNNQPADAIPLFISALQHDPTNDKIYMMLGISYAQTRNFNQAVETFLEGARRASRDRDIFFYNAGNIYFIMGEYASANEMYSRAIMENRNNGNIYLNRANARLNMQMFEEALADYRVYLVFNPQCHQRESIFQLINLLDNRVAQERELREAEEQRRLAEERRRQELLEEVLGSLQNVIGETRGASAGSERVSGYIEELDLDD